MIKSEHSTKVECCKKCGSYSYDFLGSGAFKCPKCGEDVKYMGLPIYCECKSCRTSFNAIEDTDGGIKIAIMAEVGYETAPRV